MMLNSLALRGRSLFTISSASTLPTSLRPLASQAIASAHTILSIVLEEPSIRDSMVGVPLYLHTVIAFAVVFLIKMSGRWAGIGVSVDPETKTKPLIEGVIALFRACRAGKGHILYSMADGFERLLARNFVKRETTAPTSTAEDKVALAGLRGTDSNFLDGRQIQTQGQGVNHREVGQRRILPDLYRQETLLQTPATHSTTPFVQHGNHAAHFDAQSIPPYNGQPTSAGAYAGWQTEDDMLWSMGMGYDLLATAPDVNAHGFSSFADWTAMDVTEYSGM